MLAANSFMTLISIHSNIMLSAHGIQSSHKINSHKRHEWIKDHNNMVYYTPLLKKYFIPKLKNT